MITLFIMLSHFVNAQDPTREKVRIEKVVQDFRQSIIEKDAVLFMSSLNFILSINFDHSIRTAIILVY